MLKINSADEVSTAWVRTVEIEWAGKSGTIELTYQSGDYSWDWAVMPTLTTIEVDDFLKWKDTLPVPFAEWLGDESWEYC